MILSREQAREVLDEALDRLWVEPWEGGAIVVTGAPGAVHLLCLGCGAAGYGTVVGEVDEWVELHLGCEVPS